MRGLATIILLTAFVMLYGCQALTTILTPDPPKPVCEKVTDVGGKSDQGMICTHLSDGTFDWR